MTNILKVAWIARLKSKTDSSREAALVNHAEISFATKCNYDVKLQQIENLSVFYLEILKQWQNTKQCLRKVTPSPQDEIIWNNRNIRIDGTPFPKSWLFKSVISFKMTVTFSLLINIPTNFKLEPYSIFVFGSVDKCYTFPPGQSGSSGIFSCH